MSNSFYSVGELSEVLRVSLKWIYQQLGKGNIPGAFRIGGVHFIDKEIFHNSLKEKALKPKPISKAVGKTSRHGLD